MMPAKTMKSHENKTKPATRSITFMALAILLFFPFAGNAQVPVAPLQILRAQFFDSTGKPLAAGCLNFFAAGTSTPQAIYADNTGGPQLQNPLTLDSAGEASVWMSNTAYRIVANTGVVGQPCSSALGTQLWAEDNKNIFAIINGGSNYIIASGTSDPSGSAGMLGYRSDIPCFRGFTTIWDCFVELTLTQTLTNKTLPSPTSTGTDSGTETLVNKTLTAPVVNNPSINGVTVSGVPGAYVTFPNAGAPGTILNALTVLQAGVSPANALRASTVATLGVIGVTVAGAGTTGTATVQESGTVSCIFDGATTEGDYVQISTITAGDCHDAGSVRPVTGQLIGYVLSTNGIAGTYQIDLFGHEILPQLAASRIDLTVQAANVVSTPILTPTANGFYRTSCYTVVTQAATTSSTLPGCNVFWTDADSNFAETAVLSNVNSANTVGAMGTTPVTTNSFYAKSGVSISYSTSSYASVGATPMQYALHLRLEGPF